MVQKQLSKDGLYTISQNSYERVCAGVSLAYNFIKKRLHCRCFPVSFDTFLRTPILQNICEPLLLVVNDFCCEHYSFDERTYGTPSDKTVPLLDIICKLYKVI